MQLNDLFLYWKYPPSNSVNHKPCRCNSITLIFCHWNIADYLCWWYYSLLSVWSIIWSVATTRIGFWIHNLICETLWTGAASGLLISKLEKLDWFCLTGIITLVLFMWKWIGAFLRKYHILRWWGWYYQKCLRGNRSLDLFYEVSFSWGCSVSP